MIKSIFYLLLIFASRAYAETIYITKGQEQLMPIALNNFTCKNAYDQKLSENILQVIANDLSNSGIFKIVSNNAFIENIVGINHRPCFSSWRQINSSLLLNGELKRISAKKFELSVILWDTVAEKNIFAEHFEASIDSARKLSHKISNKIYESITGEQGYFDTKVAYVSESYVKNNMIKRLAIMDYDGANHIFLTDGKHRVLSPRMSPNREHLFYVSYETGYPRIHVKNLKTGASSLLRKFSKMPLAPKFSQDGSKIIFAMEIPNGGIINIFELELKTNRLVQLTDGISLDTSPSYCGNKIYFSSNMSGFNQIYAMTDSSVERISFGAGRYQNPVCSPNGQYVAFTKIIPGQNFYLGIIKPDGSGEKIISEGYVIDGQSWDPNSTRIIFAKTDAFGKTKLYSVDINGSREVEIPTPSDASGPDWFSF